MNKLPRLVNLELPCSVARLKNTLIPLPTMLKSLQAQQMHANDLMTQPSATANLEMIKTYYLSFAKTALSYESKITSRQKS